MRELLGFMTKEFHHILRDRRTLAILLLLPVAQVLLFGFAVRTDIREIRLAVVDPSPDTATIDLQSRFQGTDLFHLVRHETHTAGLQDLFQRRLIDMALVFPVDFGASLDRAGGADLLVITDTTDPNTGSARQTYARNVIDRWTRERGQASGSVRIVPQVRMDFNPTLESVNLFVPGLIAVLLTVVSALMSAITLSREKETGTLEVLLVSPLRPWQIISGKVLPYLALGFLNVVSVLVAARVVFGVPIRGSIVLLLAECLLFIVTSLALGVLMAAVTGSQRTAMIGAIMGLMMPTVLLSGMIFPVSSMPGWLQVVSHGVPGKWFLLISRGIMLKGVGIEYLWRETAILAGMTLVFLGAALRAFSPRLD